MVSQSFFADVLGSQFQGRPMSTANLFKFTRLEPSVQRHLAKVYLTLLVASLITTAGAVVGASLAYGSAYFWLSQLLAFGSMLGLGFTAATPQNLPKRYALLGTFAFCQGVTLSPLVSVAMAVDPSVMVTALLSTLAIFVSFSGAALTTPRRSYLFLGGYISSALLTFSAMRLAGWLFGAGALTYSVELYGGLLVFAAYVIYDTQVIIEKAYAGHMDHVSHAMTLLVDLIAILVRIIVILLRNKERQEKERRDREARKDRRYRD